MAERYDDAYEGGGREPAGEPLRPERIPPAMRENDARNLAMLAHLLTLLGWAVGGWGTFLPPLLIWLIKKDTHPLLEDQCKESLNFQITVVIIMVAAGALAVLTCGLGIVVAVPVIFAVAIFQLVVVILASLAARRGEYYRYPICIRLIT